jgi:dGTPase
MDWEQLMSRERFGEAETPPYAADERSPFLRDLDRIVYSSAFRRLQGKTQVYAFPETDYVRTRLTHSLEVSSVGRSLGLAVGRRLLEGGRGLPPSLAPSDFGDVVAAACLAHDIGHPPFGHAGEEAIRNWFRFDRPELLGDLGTEERHDLESFESNAQGFRLRAHSRIPGHTVTAAGEVAMRCKHIQRLDL